MLLAFFCDRQAELYQTLSETREISFIVPWLLLFQTDINRKYRMHDKMERVASGPFVLSRSMFNRVTLKKGRYLIIPSTFDPGQIGDFVLRLYSGTNLNMM